MEEHKKTECEHDWKKNIDSYHGKQDFSGQERKDSKSQSLQAQVKEEYAMDNDVEALHSQGDEPDLVKYLKERESK